MKKLLVLAALTMAAPAAMASKARVEALGNSRQLVDVQYVFDRPYLLHSVGEQVTLEWGGKDGSGNTHAEGGFIKAHNDMVFGLYLGKQGLLTEGATEVGNGLLGEQNPINVLFGMKTGEIAWGVNVGYSNGKNDDDGTNTDLKSSSTTLNLGAEFGAWAVDVGTTLGAKTEHSGAELELKEAMNIGVDYKINEASQAYVTYNSYKWDGGEDNNLATVGYISTFAKTEDVNFFYGVAYAMGKIEGGDVSALPVWMGVETNATSWMVFRASLRQNLFINQVEDATTGDKADLDSIAFNAGLGIKAGKGMIDATFGTAQAGHLSFDNNDFMSQVSYTYNF